MMLAADTAMRRSSARSATSPRRPRAGCGSAAAGPAPGRRAELTLEPRSAYVLSGRGQHGSTASPGHGGAVVDDVPHPAARRGRHR